MIVPSVRGYSMLGRPRCLPSFGVPVSGGLPMKHALCWTLL